jgi:hypothetical protein
MHVAVHHQKIQVGGGITQLVLDCVDAVLKRHEIDRHGLLLQRPESVYSKSVIYLLRIKSRES